MKLDKKIRALLRLVDDPDLEVYDTVAKQLICYGVDIIPTLEQLWEHTMDEQIQNRIELMIHRVLFKDLHREVNEWAQKDNLNLIQGAILIAKHKYPEINIDAILKQIAEVKKNVWLELNNYLTPLEQVNVVNKILFNFYKFEGAEVSSNNLNHFFFNYLLESKKGNAFSLGILYLAICEMVDIPLFAVGVPGQFVLGYFDNLYSFTDIDASKPITQIQFFLDPMNGMVYTRSEVDVYLNKINAPANRNYFTPLSNSEIICRLLEEMMHCYEMNHELLNADEMEQLINTIKTTSKGKAS